jgi:hypothetical protein
VVIFFLATFGLLFTIWFTRFRKAGKAQIQSFGIIKVLTTVMFSITILFGINAILFWFFGISVRVLLEEITLLFQYLWIFQNETILALLPLIVAYVFLSYLIYSDRTIPMK